MIVKQNIFTIEIERKLQNRLSSLTKILSVIGVPMTFFFVRNSISICVLLVNHQNFHHSIRVLSYRSTETTMLHNIDEVIYILK